MYRLLAIEALLVAALIPALGFDYVGDDINLILKLLCGLILVAWILRGRGFARTGDGIEAAALLMLSSMAAACLSTLVTTIGFPLRDPWLAAADRILVPFLAWPDMARWIGTQDALVRLMCRIYSTLLWQPFLLAIALAAASRSDLLWRFLIAWTATLAACIVIYAFMPSLTALVFHGFRPADLPALTVNAGWRPAELIQALRAGELHSISTGSMTGLIDFPSFHAAGAVLLAFYYRRVPVVGGVFVALNLALVATVPFVGSHYFVDVVAGGLLAAAIVAGVERAPGVARENAIP